MANSRIKDMSTVTPAAATFLALDSVGTGTGKAAVSDVVEAGLPTALSGDTTALNFGTRAVSNISTLSATGNATIGGTLGVTGLLTASAGANMGSDLVTNVADPVSAQDAATKAYVDKWGTVTASAVLTTTDATQTTILTIGTTTNTAIRATVHGVFGKSDHTAAGSGMVEFGALNNGGTLALVGAVYNAALEASAALATSTIDVDSSGANLLVKVTGVAATTIKWYVTVKITTISLA